MCIYLSGEKRGNRNNNLTVVLHEWALVLEGSGKIIAKEVAESTHEGDTKVAEVGAPSFSLVKMFLRLNLPAT